ncbi:MAG: sel1 repeat family protein [Clostridia bacterium]|nr:sel1 repeat family protein [Clostridia bacterium]
MVLCNSCRHDVDFNGGICPICGATLHPTEDEIASAREALSLAIYKKNQPKALTARELLAYAGDTESEREYASFLERTDSSRRDLDLAMKFYFSAAKKNDPFSAYRYSRLVGRTSEAAGAFFLKFSGVLECVNAYPDLAEYFESVGEDEISAYYCSLAAAADDVPSIVSMAKRYEGGIGVPQSEAHAKWYLDKFKLPPLSAIKLAHRLRSVKSELPDEITFPDYDEYLNSLAVEAQAYGFDTAYYKIISILADRSYLDTQATLGILTAEGVGTDADPKEALGILMTAVMNGSGRAALYLGDAYLKEDGLFGYDVERALYYYELAVKAGAYSAYGRVGNIYYSGAHSESGVPDIALALAIFEEGAKVGDKDSITRRDEILAYRDELYTRGVGTLESAEAVTQSQAREAFKSLVIAHFYGHPSAPRALAKCYAYGFGTKRSPRDAFRLFSEAYGKGDSAAAYSLGLCYAKGFGVQFSYRDAVRYLKIALEGGTVEAGNLLYELNIRRRSKAVRGLFATACELIYMKKFTEAHRILAACMNIGYPKSIYTLGLMYEFGLGCECSRKRASELYDKARIGSAAYGSYVDDGAKYKSKFLKIIKRI